ncbi:PucR family transcriptional regulator, partial [Streptomyces sp. B1866]|nr:PucR family transcriptional regulator [Streptomyces sp. B1866]
RYAADAERLRARPAPASAVAGGSGPPEEPADRVELHTLGTSGYARGVLAVGTGGPLGAAERYALHAAVALLTLVGERSRTLREAERRLGGAVLRMLLAGEPDHARAVAGELYGDLLDAPFRVLVAEPAAPAAHPPAAEEARPHPTGTADPPPAAPGPDPLRFLADAVETAAARHAEPALVVPDGEHLVVLAPDGGAAVAACAEHAAAA